MGIGFVISPCPSYIPNPTGAKGIIFIFHYFKTYNFNFADLSFQSVKPENLCINLIVLTFFGTIVGQCYSIYFREAVPSILTLIVALLYTMSFSVFTFTKSDNALLNPNDSILKLQFLYLPLVIFGGGGILL
jgi:hypothetical protein